MFHIKQLEPTTSVLEIVGIVSPHIDPGSATLLTKTGCVLVIVLVYLVTISLPSNE